MRLSLVVLAVAAVVIAFSGMLFAIDTSPCSDGTLYGKCSSKSPGYYCTGSLSNPALGPLLSVCPCTNYPGWVQDGAGDEATCIQAKCDDGTKMGECTANKPKFCVGGSTYADNATKCGCPSGQKASPAGISCEYLPCSDGTKDGICSSKSVGKKCVQSVLVDKASECACKSGYTKIGEACVLQCSDGTESGKCSLTKPKECNENGYLLDNAGKCGCPDGQVADSSGKRCVPGGIGGISGSDLLGGSSSGGNQSAGGSGAGLGGLQCCCLPTALIGLAGGFAFFRKRE